MANFEMNDFIFWKIQLLAILRVIVGLLYAYCKRLCFGCVFFVVVLFLTRSVYIYIYIYVRHCNYYYYY